MPCGGNVALVEILADNSVRVTGTIDDSGCQSFSVSVAHLTVYKSPSPDENGNWVLTYSGTEITGNIADFRREACGKRWKISIRCDDTGSNCSQTRDVDIICENDENCPSVTFTITPDDCVNGRRTVHIVADVISTNDATYVWFFGTDEDNQPGEDSQAGDGNGNIWLPAPDANGVRTVEVDHVYEPTGSQPTQVTVRLQTSQGPNLICDESQSFTLDPCNCDSAVALEVVNQTGSPVPGDRCLQPGDYTVRVTNPTGNSLDYSWSVDGSADTSQLTSDYDFSIAAGEEKTISVVVEQGACDASNAVAVEGCEDCSSFDAQLRVLNDARRDVTGARCLPAGNYTVQATSPTGAGNSFRWFVNSTFKPNETGSTIQVALGDDDQQTVMLDASRGNCSDIVSVTLTTCDDEDDDDDTPDGFIPCMMFKILALIGLGLFLLGAILLLCPAIGMPLLPPPVAIGIGIALMIGGGLLLSLGLVLWQLICRPTQCDWFAFLWQSLILLGLLMIYAGFCPACAWMLIGAVPLILGAILAIVWGRNCNITRCRALAEWISLFTFVVNVVAILEIILAACVITMHTPVAIIWGIVIAGFQAWLWFEANRNNCISN